MNHRELLNALLPVMEEAGALALDCFHRRGGLQVRSKPDGSLYSEADLAVNDLLRHRLRALVPQCGWLSEEDADDRARLRQHRLWIVDPIDGSRAFLEGRPQFTICVALIENGVPLLSAISAPACGEQWYALGGGGAWHNGAPLPRRRRFGVAEAGYRLLVSGRLRRKPLWRELFAQQHPPEDNRPPPGSIAYRLLLVARGDCDATLSITSKQEWDLAAAHLIAAESGVLCSARDGAPLCYNRRDTACAGVLAAPEGLHQRLAQLTRSGLAQEAKMQEQTI